jgi:hypothetical protein
MSSWNLFLLGVFFKSIVLLISKHRQESQPPKEKKREGGRKGGREEKEGRKEGKREVRRK